MIANFFPGEGSVGVINSMTDLKMLPTMSRITLATGSLARNPATEGCSGGLATGTYEHPKFQGI